MSYSIENIFICLAAPFLIAAICSGKSSRKNFIFIMVGFLCCVLAAYLNTFFMVLYKADSTAAVMEITPVVEETIKLLPLLFYLFVFEADESDGNMAAFHIAIGFATFENIRYLLENGTNNLFHLVIRGFSAGAMHIACAFMVGYGLRLLKRSSLIKAAGLFGLLCVCITFHAIFNMLMKTDGVLRQIGYAIPITVIGAQIALKHHLKKYL